MNDEQAKKHLELAKKHEVEEPAPAKEFEFITKNGGNSKAFYDTYSYFAAKNAKNWHERIGKAKGKTLGDCIIAADIGLMLASEMYVKNDKNKTKRFKDYAKVFIKIQLDSLLFGGIPVSLSSIKSAHIQKDSKYTPMDDERARNYLIRTKKSEISVPENDFEFISKEFITKNGRGSRAFYDAYSYHAATIAKNWHKRIGSKEGITLGESILAANVGLILAANSYLEHSQNKHLRFKDLSKVFINWELDKQILIA